MTKFLKPEKAPSLMDLPDPAVYQRADWLIVFCRGAPHWWDKFQRDGFHHIFAATWTGHGWIVVNPTMASTETKFIPAGHSDFIGHLVHDAENTAIIRCKSTIKRRSFRCPHVLTAWTCVEHMKALIGIRASLVFTPFQLYRHLLGGNNGQSFRAKEIKRASRVRSEAGRRA
ncbi:MAG: hypothetical protein HKP56_05245 [Anderseniella sp.]|nr:hypothetical protein [Anderseniella sp.]